MGNLVKHSLVLDQEDELLTQSNEFGKQGRKKPRNIPKFTINHERFSCAIEKKYLKHTPTHNLLEPFNLAGVALESVYRAL